MFSLSFALQKTKTTGCITRPASLWVALRLSRAAAARMVLHFKICIFCYATETQL